MSDELKTLSVTHYSSLIAVLPLVTRHCSAVALAVDWNGIELMKSRRADVERILGKPRQAQPGQGGTLHFQVLGGKVTVAFVDARFVATKKLHPELEGTVLQIILQHENSSETPESM